MSKLLSKLKKKINWGSSNGSNRSPPIGVFLETNEFGKQNSDNNYDFLVPSNMNKSESKDPDDYLAPFDEYESKDPDDYLAPFDEYESKDPDDYLAPFDEYESKDHNDYPLPKLGIRSIIPYSSEKVRMSESYPEINEEPEEVTPDEMTNLVNFLRNMENTEPNNLISNKDNILVKCSEFLISKTNPNESILFKKVRAEYVYKHFANFIINLNVKSVDKFIYDFFINKDLCGLVSNVKTPFGVTFDCKNSRAINFYKKAFYNSTIFFVTLQGDESLENPSIKVIIKDLKKTTRDGRSLIDIIKEQEQSGGVKRKSKKTRKMKKSRKTKKNEKTKNSKKLKKTKKGKINYSK
jgi:hypothetical protein